MSANQKKDKKDKSNKKQVEEMNYNVSDLDEEEGNIIVEMTDAEGNVFLYEEEMIIPIDDKKFALLVALPYESEEGGYHYHEHGCDCGCEDDDVIIAKIITNAEGEEEYVEPTDEEFEIVRQAYNDFFSDENVDLFNESEDKE